MEAAQQIKRGAVVFEVERREVADYLDFARFEQGLEKSGEFHADGSQR